LSFKLNGGGEMKINLFKEIKKLEAERDLYKKVLIQIATQPRGSLSRRLALSVVDLVNEVKRVIPDEDGGL
jgi:hypothetical protein